jgi:exodeoxyribonuclease VII small subunit
MEQLTFEKSLERLAEIVKLLEKGEAPLDQSMALFEEGTGLIRSCTAMLDAAEQKVVQLKKGEDGQPVELPFDTQE